MDNQTPTSPQQPTNNFTQQSPYVSAQPKKRLNSLMKFILFLVVLVLCVGGVYYWQHKKVNNLNQQLKITNSQLQAEKKQVSSLQAEATKESKASSSSYTSTDAVSLVQSAYNTVLAYDNKTSSGVSQAEINTIEDDLTPSLYSTLSTKKASGSDPILCSQELPSALTAVAGQTSNGVSTVLVNETFGSSIDKVTTTVDLSNLKIASITCPLS